MNTKEKAAPIRRTNETTGEYTSRQIRDLTELEAMPIPDVKKPLPPRHQIIRRNRQNRDVKAPKKPIPEDKIPDGETKHKDMARISISGENIFPKK